MTRRSLRVRLWVGAALSIGVAILVAGLGLVTLFERHVERRMGAELESLLNQLAAAVELAADGSVSLAREPLDPDFSRPLSGRYWQIDGPDRPGLLRSRSLWDELLVLPQDPLEPGRVHAHLLPGPDGQWLLVRERRVQIETKAASIQLRLAVARDRAELLAARADFAADMRPYLGLIVLVLVLATLFQIHTGLAPLETLRRGLGAIRSGESPRLDERYPDEVMPLVRELNALLDARAQAVERARAWTADLAHGLKTPLSALVADAERLRQQGHPTLAEDLEQLAETMRRRVDRELVRARVRSGGAPHAARTDVVAALRGLLRTLERTPDGARIAWHIQAPDEALAALMPGDLMELLGNLLENAAKWARARVEVLIETSADRIEIQIADDGPGIPPEQWPRLGERGVRLDQHKEGSGLGLAIVRDVIDAYAGELAFAPAAAGGLLVRLRLPGVD